LKTRATSMRQTPRECEEKWESLQRGICCLRSTESTEAVIVAATRPLGTSRRRSEHAPALTLKRHSHESWIIPRSLFPSRLPSLFLVARYTALSCERNEAPQNPHRGATASRNAVTALRAIGSRPAPPAARCARIGICGHLGPGDAVAIAQRRGGHQALMLVIKRHDADPTDRLVVDIGKARCESASRAAPATRRAYLRAA
jgi:hypothetical protein